MCVLCDGRVVIDVILQNRFQLSEVFVVSSLKPHTVVLHGWSISDCTELSCTTSSRAAIDPSSPPRSTQMKGAAASIGLSWRGSQRSCGQPSFQTRYEDALSRHIRTQYAVPAGITTAQRSSWWRQGNGFVEEPIVPAALDAAMVPSLEHLGEIPEGAAGDDDAAAPKRGATRDT